jgi:hypothetical protein
MMIKREELTGQFVTHQINGLDLDDLIQIVYEHLIEGYENMTESELLGEIREFAPHLLDLDNKPV